MGLALGATPAIAEMAGTPEGVIAQLLGSERAARADLGTGRIARLASVAPTTTQEGMHSESWISARPAATGGAQWQCLTEALYFEARGESAEGLFAVAEVILNRVDSPRYPGTVCDVVNQGTGKRHACQFSYTCDGRPEEVHDQSAWQRVGKVARAMLDGAPRGLTDGALFYHTRSVTPSWARKFHRTASIGVHHFYR
ncbi:MAG TPA: cell wall hydrolase [Rhodobacterales bacterium]|nr:cell wall hydrolase [Rhodobacterales bacterium]